MTREEFNQINYNAADLTAEKLEETWSVLNTIWNALYMRSQAEQEAGKGIDRANIKIRRAVNTGAMCAHIVRDIIERCDK